MKKALLMKHKNHYLDIELEKAFSHGLEMAGFETTLIDMDELAETIDDYEVEKYDMIAFDVLYNSQFLSGKGRSYLFEELGRRAKKGALTMYACDIKLPLQAHIWEKGHNIDKRNVFDIAPIKVLASLDPSIMKDEESYERMKGLWMKDLHEDSTIHFAEWISFAYHTYGKDIDSDTVFNEGIRNFYYGMNRSFIARSLVRMGLGGKDDLVYGSIGTAIRDEEVRKINQRVRKPFSWVEYVNNSQSVLFPYEPIKSDYQITVRLLEAKLFYKDKVVFDDRVSKDLIEYAHSPDPWIKKSKETAELIKELYN